MTPSRTSRIKNATMQDVAARSGVSYQTVSRVVNDLPEVAETTRQRVLRAMDELGYRPNLNARQLVRQRSTVVGVVTFGTGLNGPTQIMVNVEQVVKELGLGVMFCGILEESVEEIRRAVNELCSYQVVGILIHLPLTVDLRPLQDVCRNVPLVAVDSDLGFPAPAVFVHQELGSRRGTRHLLRFGHKQIAFLRAPLVWRAARLRFEGWERELAAAGTQPGPVVDGDWSAASGYDAAKRLLAHHWGRFSAIVAANDQMALGTIRALEEAGVRVPADVSVVGFDDLPEAAFFRPPLTTLHQDFALLARLSVSRLMAQINGEAVDRKAPLIRPRLVTRQTTARCPQAFPHLSGARRDEKGQPFCT